MKGAILLFVTIILAVSAYAIDDKSASYQMGTFVSSSIAADGTLTDTLHGDGTTVTGSVHENQLAIYRLEVPDGFWNLETYTQNKDSMIRQMGMTPMHFKSEKNNPLDLLKGGERVLFRVEKHKKLNGVEISVYIPYADNPSKEFHYIGYFSSSKAIVEPEKPTDNVKAMCNAHKLSPELEKQYCVDQPLNAASSSAAAHPSQAMGEYSASDLQTAANLSKLSCAQINTMIQSTPLIATYLPLTWKTAQERCKR